MHFRKEGRNILGRKEGRKEKGKKEKKEEGGKEGRRQGERGKRRKAREFTCLVHLEKEKKVHLGEKDKDKVSLNTGLSLLDSTTVQATSMVPIAD